MNSYNALLSSLSRDARAIGWCWRIRKGIAENGYPLEIGRKKGKATPVSSEATLP